MKLEWFGKTSDAAQYLHQWRSVPLTYQPGQAALDSTWHIDDYLEPLGQAETGWKLACAAQLLWGYQFYPGSILASISQFGLADRPMRVGDRMVQRIHVLRWFNRPLLDVLTMNEVIAVVDEPRLKGFTYATTAAHAEVGEWSARVEWRADASLWLLVHSQSKALLPGPLRWYARRLQKRAHLAGLVHFKQLLAAQGAAAQLSGSL